MVDPRTTESDFLTIMAWTEVVRLLKTPRVMPRDEVRCMASPLTPMRKPTHTMATPARRARDDLLERSRYEKKTVKGRTRPRATW